MSKTMDFKWKDDIGKPMNPFAEEDFRNAMKQASKDIGKRLGDFSEDLKRVGEQMKVNADCGKVSFIDFDDMPTEYSGAMRLNYEGTLQLSDLLDALLENGYEVTARLEDATETEKKLDRADKFVVIEYEEV